MTTVTLDPPKKDKVLEMGVLKAEKVKALQTKKPFPKEPDITLTVCLNMLLAITGVFLQCPDYHDARGYTSSWPMHQKNGQDLWNRVPKGTCNEHATSRPC
jgi:hypothetical protein